MITEVDIAAWVEDPSGMEAEGRVEIARLALAGLAAQWRPIDTAPTDGSWILLARSDNGFVGEGYRTRTFATFAANGFRIDDVTHWMPLPAPPEADR